MILFLLIVYVCKLLFNYSMPQFLVDSSGGNAQSLLLCCWHCMKEISLLLGYIVETASLGEGQILSIEEVCKTIVLCTMYCNFTKITNGNGIFAWICYIVRFPY